MRKINLPGIGLAIMAFILFVSFSKASFTALPEKQMFHELKI